MAPSRCLAAAVAFAVLLACVPSHGQGLNDLACDHDGKPAQPGNLRVSGNKMDGENKYSEITVSFDQPHAGNRQSGCTSTYRVELLENGQPIVKEWVDAPSVLKREVDFTRKLNPGKTYSYRVAAVNGKVSPARESDFAYTSQFTTAQQQNGGGNMGVSSGPMALCNKDGKPGQPGNPRVVRNEMLNAQYAEVTVQFDVPQAKDSSLGCATMYRIELMEDSNNWVSKENVKADGPGSAQVTFARKFNPGKTYYYKITGINDMVNPARESDSAFTGRFTTGVTAVPGGRRMAM
ncbi:hypothetical protein Rsub_05144 [Raphidocelis subcapitata]|uniref:Fibronectin type-III domain-containing protein n=1 Tax=Raphidocelis subcapitata TaxID=307507 RepID=A0A2V0P3V4_9CHLO|nr:hypothetical protein Rsub_05144 [Raphidocelis subcapitata]|eukprot:GBF92530.1 hypothetical protein Rsub_05144 [Raphidocelis subcapitata]